MAKLLRNMLRLSKKCCLLVTKPIRPFFINNYLTLLTFEAETNLMYEARIYDK